MTEDVSLKDFEKLIDATYELDNEKDKLEEQIKELNKKISENQNKIMLEMKRYEKTSYKGKYGTLIMNKKWSWKQPKDPLERELFFSYLRKKGLFDSMISVNANTLNAFAKAEMEIAIRQKDMNFVIPGLDKPTFYETISLRRT